MTDPIFENPRLVQIYDAFDGTRHDLAHYLAIVKELNARSVLDVGSGTGCFSTLLAAQGYDVVGVEPAKASHDAARRKPHADKVRWILGDTSALPALAVDMVVMTGNVAQVFVTDEAWEANLLAIRKALRPGGHLVFEVRDPARKAWLGWTREKTYERKEVPGIGAVEAWCDVGDVSGDCVSFRWTYVFERDGTVLTSDSTLRFRSKDEIVQSLNKTGYVVRDIRDAPDRPGQEFVFIAGVVG